MKQYFFEKGEGYTWGVFKALHGETPKFYASTYQAEQHYSALIKGNLSKEDAERVAAAMNDDHQEVCRVRANKIVEALLGETEYYKDTGEPMSKAHIEFRSHFRGSATPFICNNCGAHCKTKMNCPACDSTDIVCDNEYKN